MEAGPCRSALKLRSLEDLVVSSANELQQLSYKLATEIGAVQGPSKRAPQSELKTLCDEVETLRRQLHDKTQAYDALKMLFQRSEKCHNMTISGLSKCIGNQSKIIELNQEAFLKTQHDYKDDDLVEMLAATPDADEP